MSTNQFRRYLDLLNEELPELPNTTQTSSEPRCAVCGTPKSQHQALKHQFVAGGVADRPAPVAQGGVNLGRVKRMQAELKAAGAELGDTGANRDGIDGDIGPLTTDAMDKYPNIAAKYPDLRGPSSAAPAAQAATPAVDTSKLNAALSAIESIIAKYKGKTKVSESQIREADQPSALTPSQVRQQKLAQAAQFAQASMTPAAPNQPAQSIYDRFNKPSGAPTGPAKAIELKPSGWASNVGKKILSKLPGLGARTAGRAGAAAVSGPLAPLVGAAGALYTVWDIGNMLYDAYKDSDNLEGMNDADQAVIKQNLAVVNSFMKDPKVADTLPQDIKTRVENVMTDLVKLSVDTGSATPAATQQAATPSATPAAKAVPTVDTTVAELDKLLKKYNFESREPRTLSEQLARDRDIVDEGLASAAVQHVIKPVAKWGVKTFVKPIATVGGWGGIGYGGYETWKTMTAPKAMSAADKAEFDRILADYKKMVPDQATFDALPKPVQEKLIAVADRIVKMQQQQPPGN